ncbi:MAG: hypothetical protein M9962_02350 [Oligoflexia bacterium]|nr:hypothetical protein [Oligoflexia bacterium]
MSKKTREAKEGELREIHALESLERLSKRPESRMDVQNLLENLSEHGKIYARHLITSGPSSLLAAAKACKLKVAEIESALTELETKIKLLKS